MKLAFYKLHGIGNDFVFLDLVREREHLGEIAPLAQAMCDRHRGIGADGLIIVTVGVEAPFRMTMYNPDGSNGGMCGNGVRCTAKLLIDHGHQAVEPFDLEVEDRIVQVDPLEDGNIRVDMGMASLTREEIGILGEPEDRFIQAPLQIDDHTYSATGVSMGNPHIVIFIEDLDTVDLNYAGPKLERHPMFPFRTNVHFAKVLSRTRLVMRTWERGAGITLACGSGACSVGVAAFLNGLTERQTDIQLPGGNLRVHYLENGRVLMEGPAAASFHGEWDCTER